MAVYPCTYRELNSLFCSMLIQSGISLYLQGTPQPPSDSRFRRRYIPVPTGNSCERLCFLLPLTVYPCTYRELTINKIRKRIIGGISLYLQGTQRLIFHKCHNHRYIPVPTGNSSNSSTCACCSAVYPCTYRELKSSPSNDLPKIGISLYLQGTHFSFSSSF